MRFIYIFAFIILSISITNAQKLAAPSTGFFGNAMQATIVMEDSTKAMYTVDTSRYASLDNEYPDVFYLINAAGDSITLEPEELIYAELPRGRNRVISQENTEDDEDEDEDAEYVNLLETTYLSDQVIYERVRLDQRNGLKLKGAYKQDYMLLQLASVGFGERIKVYVYPDLDGEGTQVAPIGIVTDRIARNRVDYVEVQKYYFIQIDNEPAILISDETYEEYAPMIFGACRAFRSKYGVSKEMDDAKTAKRKKTTRKAVGNGKKKASLLKYAELSKHLKDYHEMIVIQDAEEEAKRKEREAARARN